MLGREAGAKMVAWGQSRWEGPGHQEEGPARASGCCAHDRAVSILAGPSGAPGSVRSCLRSLSQSPDPRSLSEDRPRFVRSVGLAHWRTVLGSSWACPVLSAGASLELPLTGGRGQTRGAGSSRGRWSILGSAPGTTAQGQGVDSARPAPASPRGALSAPSGTDGPLLLPRPCDCGHRDAAAVDVRLEASGRNVSEPLGRQVAHGWTPEMRATPQTILRGPGTGDGNVWAQTEHLVVRWPWRPRPVPGAADWGPHHLQGALWRCLHRMGADDTSGAWGPGLHPREGPMGLCAWASDPQSPDTAPQPCPTLRHGRCAPTPPSTCAHPPSPGPRAFGITGQDSRYTSEQLLLKSRCARRGLPHPGPWLRAPGVACWAWGGPPVGTCRWAPQGRQ